jgi:hypothetical protein
MKNHSPRLTVRAKQRRRRFSLGVATVEYSTLLLILGIPAGLGMLLGGASMAEQYAQTRATILNANP